MEQVKTEPVKYTDLLAAKETLRKSAVAYGKSWWDDADKHIAARAGMDNAHDVFDELLRGALVRGVALK